MDKKDTDKLDISVIIPINFSEYDPKNIDVWDTYVPIGNEKEK